VLHRPFAIKWLNLAVLWELALLVLIVYAPVLQMPFGTFSLTLKDWAIVIGLSLTISAVLELVTWVELRGWFGAMS
jgi:Ca2+-transporting ATPase